MKRLKKKYQLGGRESQIAETNQGLLRQDGKPQSLLRDAGNLWLDTVLAPIGGVIGQDLYNPEYSTKLGEIGSKVGNAAGSAIGKIGMSALKFAQGGDLEMIQGPSHEMGGMAITPNAEAEGGETKIDDYIFSDLLKPQGSKHTFAKRSKSINNKFKLRPNDPLSKEAKTKELSALRDEQEALREQMKADKMQEIQSLMQPDFEGMSDMIEMRAGGKIRINPKNKGKFTASAKRAGMGVQEFARHVLANKSNYSSTQVKRANFARNASKWHHELGGPMKYALGGPPIDELPDFSDLIEPSLGIDDSVARAAVGDYGSTGTFGPQVSMEGYTPYTAPTDIPTEDVYEFNNSLLPLGTNIAGNVAKTAMLLGANKGRLTPNVNLNKLNAQPAIDIAQQNTNNALAAGLRGLRDNSISSGQFLANADILAGNLGTGAGANIADIVSNYANANTGIGNEQIIRNNAITQGNNFILDQAEANRINQAAGIIDNTVGAVQQYGRDEQSQNNYNIAANNMLPAGTKIKYVRGKNGKMIPKVVADPAYLGNMFQYLQ